LLLHTVAEIDRFISISHETIYKSVYFDFSAHKRVFIGVVQAPHLLFPAESRTISLTV